MPVGSKRAEGPPTLDVVIRKLGERRKRLDALDDRLAHTIRVVEDVLRTHVAVRVEQMISFNDFVGEFQRLAWTKNNGKWALVVEDGEISNGRVLDAKERTALSNCSRELRSEMFAGGHIEQLLRSAIEQVEAEITKREAAMTAAEGLLTSLGPSAKDTHSPSPFPPDDEELPF